MYSESDIDGAITAGALSVEAAAALRAHVAAGHGEPAVDEEHFRLLTGFNDIFVSIAVVLLLVAVAQIGMRITPALGGVLVAGAAWALAEFFTARRRMALPSILLLLAFVGGVAGACAGLIETVAPHVSDRLGALAGAGVALAAALAALLHWRRFMVPITVAAGAAAVVATVIALALAAIPAMRDAIYPLLLIGGLAVFAVAMRWDLSDRARVTRRADVAFWLHLVAAPMIAHALFNLIGVFGAEIGVGVAIVVLALYVAFGFVALAIDRRALLVSSLAYVLYAMYALFRSAGAIELSAAFTAFVIGSALLCLSAFWHPIRRLVVGTLGGLGARLPPISAADAHPWTEAPSA
ncbi:hypothetical protein [Sphingomonas oligophenolica]|uniref:DUF2157 domain-containing protein n=1 Tax=Sphingomonas oligophenolica TaxID=301154 RepID=A0A502CHK8_9SPHN|nr:hypothetical protein [Sphingomonas oligophenolica]TPG12202.1 hypothetical protein EAH84_10105 [Sphingomonas oligophenolica]